MSRQRPPAKAGTRPDWLNNITSIFGYDRRIKLPSCAALAFSAAADDLNPFSPGTFGAIKDGLEAALATGQLYYFTAALSHAAARGLTYPNKSSIFRGLLKNSSDLGKAAGDNQVGIAAGNVSFGITCPYGPAACQAGPGGAQALAGILNIVSFGHFGHGRPGPASTFSDSPRAGGNKSTTGVNL